MFGPAVRADDRFSIAVSAEVEQLMTGPACLIVVRWALFMFCSFDFHFACPPFRDSFIVSLLHSFVSPFHRALIRIVY